MTSWLSEILIILTVFSRHPLSPKHRAIGRWDTSFLPGDFLWTIFCRWFPSWTVRWHRCVKRSRRGPLPTVVICIHWKRVRALRNTMCGQTALRRIFFSLHEKNPISQSGFSGCENRYFPRGRNKVNRNEFLGWLNGFTSNLLVWFLLWLLGPCNYHWALFFPSSSLCHWK